MYIITGWAEGNKLLLDKQLTRIQAIGVHVEGNGTFNLWCSTQFVWAIEFFFFVGNGKVPGENVHTLINIITFVQRWILRVSGTYQILKNCSGICTIVIPYRSKASHGHCKCWDNIWVFWSFCIKRFKWEFEGGWFEWDSHYAEQETALPVGSPYENR